MFIRYSTNVSKIFIMKYSKQLLIIYAGAIIMAMKKEKQPPIFSVAKDNQQSRNSCRRRLQDEKY